MPQYQGVWTLEAQAQAQSNQQWVTDPNFRNTTLLLQADGTGNGSQNNTFLDSSTNNFFITRSGNTTQGSFSPFSQAAGYWGNYFDGSSRLTLPSNAAFAFGTGAYTVEFFVYFIGIGGTEARFFDAGSATNSFGVGTNSSNVISITKYGTSDVLITASNALVRNQWNHIAVVRDSTSTNATRIYINGILSVTGTDSNNWTVTTTPTIAGLGIAGYYPTCYLSNLRVTKGGALYASNFTPTTAPLTTSVSAGTVSLLTCQSNRFVDNSANAFTISVGAGSPSVQGFSPFAPALQWTPTVVGGSGYFDGNGDYLTGPNASGGDFSTGDFTISAWFYPTTLTGGTDHGIMSYADTGGWNGWQLQARGTARDIKFEFLTGSAGASTITGGTIVLNAWNYVAIVRSGSTVSMYVNSTTAATSTTNSTAYGAATSRVIVGADRSAASLFIGYISNSKLVKQANAPASIPTVPDTATTNTSFLLNYTNAGIYDGAMEAIFETVNADIKVAATPVKYGSGSLSFVSASTGSSIPYLLANNNTNLYALYTGDFTVEAWVYIVSNNDITADMPIVNYGNGGANGPLGTATCWAFLITNNGAALKLYRNTDAVTEVVYTFGTSATVPYQQWNHVAITRANGSMRAFVNGVQVGSTTAATTNYSPISGTNRLFVGAQTGGGGANQYYKFPGYMDDVRVTQGVARYIANFTPPQQALPRQ
jgi:hypothetical protein